MMLAYVPVQIREGWRKKRMNIKRHCFKYFSFLFFSDRLLFVQTTFSITLEIELNIN